MLRHDNAPLSQGPSPEAAVLARPGNHALPLYDFVVVSDEDLARAAPLIRVAESEGQRLWIPQRCVRTDDAIENAMNAAAGIVVFCTSQAQQSAQDGIALATRANKPLSIVFLDQGPETGAGVASRDAARPVAAKGARPRPHRRSLLQTGINAFAAGSLLLFMFASMQISGGPPTKYEFQDVAARVKTFLFTRALEPLRTLR